MWRAKTKKDFVQIIFEQIPVEAVQAVHWEATLVLVHRLELVSPGARERHLPAVHGSQLKYL